MPKAGAKSTRWKQVNAMLSVHGRKPAAVVVEPVAKGLLKIGLTPNATTVAGTVLTMLTAMVLSLIHI